MKAFCPNCGTAAEGMPGGRLTCQACTASFEVPREGSTAPEPFAPTMIPKPASAPVRQPPAPVQPPPQFGAPSILPQGYVGPPATGFNAGSGMVSGPNNQLAIASLVLGILCCVPFASIAAIVTGVMAINQIQAAGGAQKGRELAIGGIVLGGTSILLTLVSLLTRLGR
jgi:hypothetical protein